MKREVWTTCPIMSTAGNKTWPSMIWIIIECPSHKAKTSAYLWLRDSSLPFTSCKTQPKHGPSYSRGHRLLTQQPRTYFCKGDAKGRKCRSSGTKYGAPNSSYCCMTYLTSAGQWTLLKVWLASADSLQIASCDYMQAREKYKSSSCF